MATGPTTSLHVLRVSIWLDPRDTEGFDPRSDYVEYCWLPILGPTATILYRRLGHPLASGRAELELDAVDLSLCLGLGRSLAPSGALPRALARLSRFGLAEISPDGSKVMIRVLAPPLAGARLSHLSLTARSIHDRLTASA